MSHRTSEGEHEGSRRMKTELLIQMDGLAKTEAHVFLLAASNLPWELDTAMLRRLEKRILIDLPDNVARQDMFERLLPRDSVVPVKDLDYQCLAEKTSGYSGADISLICKEAAMRPLRQFFAMLETRDSIDTPTSFQRRPVEMDDVIKAIDATKPTCDAKMQEKYQKWQSEFGAL